jgi:hypothetical protein
MFCQSNRMQYPYVKQGKNFVNLQTTKRVEAYSPEIVLPILEASLRKVWQDVVRAGDEVIVHGLGPSPRSINRHDKTVFRASAEGNATLININATFQASALLGDLSEGAVRSKLDGVMETVASQLSLEQARHGAPPSLQPVMVPSPEPSFVPEPDPLPPIPTPAEPLPPLTPEPESPPAARPEPLLPPVPTPVIVPPAVPRRLELTPEPKLIPESMIASEPELVTPEPVAELKPEPVPAPVEPEKKPFPAEPELLFLRSVPTSKPEPETVLDIESDAPMRRRGVKVFLAAVVTLALLVAVPYLLPFIHRTAPATETTAALSSSESTPQDSASQSQNVPASQAQEPPKPEVAASVPATQPAPNPDATDLKSLLDNWTAAMGTPDATVQASFYADVLDRYFLRSEVSNAVVLKDKQAAINARKNPWTLRVENLIIEQQTETTARVSLIQHYIAQPGQSTASEQRIKTQLKLKRIDGKWKIVSERILG